MRGLLCVITPPSFIVSIFMAYKYTAHQHREGVIKVEIRDRVICDCIGDMQTAELIAHALNELPILKKENQRLSETIRALKTSPCDPFQ